MCNSILEYKAKIVLKSSRAATKQSLAGIVIFQIETESKRMAFQKRPIYLDHHRPNTQTPGIEFSTRHRSQPLQDASDNDSVSLFLSFDATCLLLLHLYKYVCSLIYLVPPIAVSINFDFADAVRLIVF